MHSPVVVWADKFATGFNGGGLEGLEAHPVVDLADALYEDYDTDAHFVPYSLIGPDGSPLKACPRINKGGREEVEAAGYLIRFYSAVIDVDCPSDIKSKKTAPEEWRNEQLHKLKSIEPKLQSGMGMYDTLGGYRLVWRLSEPAAPEKYLSIIAAIRNELRKKEIVADQLVDWTRCYRLPSVVRDGDVQDHKSSLLSLGYLVWQPPKQNKKSEGGVFNSR